MKMEAGIRKVQKGDANAPAYIQTESWKAAFAGIPDTETLAKCTNIDRAAGMYQRLPDKNMGNGYILSADGKPRCIAYRDEARDAEFTGKAELLCIHSLPDNWHKGHDSQMMEQVLKDIREAGYSEVVRWASGKIIAPGLFMKRKG
jgi:hypothetical protein